MAVRIFYEWGDRLNQLNRVEIDDNTYSGNPIEVVAGATPFCVEFPERDLIDKPVVGNGAKLSFLYRGSENFMRNFFTNDIKRHTVTHTIDGVVNWNGYLNTEVYVEDYSSDGSSLGIEFEMSANNGLAILDRLYFYDDLPNEHTVTPFDIIKYCLGRTELDLRYIYYNCDIILRNPAETPIEDDILNYTLISASNYINEDSERETCRTVLESALLLYRLNLRKIGRDIYIESVNTKAQTSSKTYRVYDLINEVFLSNQSLSNPSLLVGENHWFGTGQSLEYETGINNQVISVDTYPVEKVLPNELSKDDKFEDDYTVIDHNAVSDYEYTEHKYNNTAHADFEFTGTLSSNVDDTYPSRIIVDKEEVENKGTSNEDVYVGVINTPTRLLGEIGNIPDSSFNGAEYTNDIVIKTKVLLPPLRFTEIPPSMQLKLSAMIQKDIDAYYKEKDKTNTIRGFECGGYLKIGDYYLRGILNSWYSPPEGQTIHNRIDLDWTTTPSTFPLVFTSSPTATQNSPYDSLRVSDRWVSLFNYSSSKFSDYDYVEKDDIDSSFGFLEIPVPTNVKLGEVIQAEFGISYYYCERHFWWNTVTLSYTSEGTSSLAPLHEAILFKDFELNVESEALDGKIEFVGEGDGGYKDSGQELSLIMGTSNEISPLQKGAYMIKMTEYGNPSNYSIFSPTKYGSQYYFSKESDLLKKPEEALMQTLMANRQNPMVKINASFKYEDINEYCLINFPDLEDKNFIFIGGEIDYRDLSIRGTWKEINPD
ncbi:MAG: hypothetical protein FK734_15345 [Asgard group archaeon]|nr:hypothetical protein [Asgard group archaeon]